LKEKFKLKHVDNHNDLPLALGVKLKVNVGCVLTAKIKETFTLIVNPKAIIL